MGLRMHPSHPFKGRLAKYVIKVKNVWFSTAGPFTTLIRECEDWV